MQRKRSFSLEDNNLIFFETINDFIEGIRFSRTSEIGRINLAGDSLDACLLRLGISINSVELDSEFVTRISVASKKDVSTPKYQWITRGVKKEI